MNAYALGGVFLVGLLGGVHCMGMCGGIVSALAANSGQGRARTVQPVHVGQPVRDALERAGAPALASAPPPSPAWRLQLAFNAGRIASYSVAGAVAGWTGALSLFVAHLLPVQALLYGLANLMLVALGLYLFGITRYIAPLERAGARLWARLRPLLGRLLPADTLPRALGLGALWGWVPCGLVYSMLMTAVLSGGALPGAVVMLAFGLGTLPNLLFAGALMRWLSGHTRGRRLRQVAGGAVLATGLWGLAHAAGVNGHALSSLFCITPA
jgi:sulfite exporter TauE/SafE